MKSLFFSVAVLVCSVSYAGDCCNNESCGKHHKNQDNQCESNDCDGNCGETIRQPIRHFLGKHFTRHHCR